MYLLSASLEAWGTLFVRSVSCDVYADRSFNMSSLFLLLGIGMNERPFSSNANSCGLSGYEDLFVTNLLLRRAILCL